MYYAQKNTLNKKWFVVDAQGKTLGRLASRIAFILQGKHKPEYTPYLDTGDNLIVINADKIVLTGKKLSQKVYYRHSNYPGGLKSVTANEFLKKKPEQLIKIAVKGMLPKNKLGRALFKKLKVYASPNHPHAAQKPAPLEFKKEV